MASALPPFHAGDGSSPHAMEAPIPIGHLSVVRYRGFVLIPQRDLTWLVRPERSPMQILPFRTPASSLTDVKALIDWRLQRAMAS